MKIILVFYAKLLIYVSILTAILVGIGYIPDLFQDHPYLAIASSLFLFFSSVLMTKIFVSYFLADR